MVKGMTACTTIRSRRIRVRVKARARVRVRVRVRLLRRARRRKVGRAEERREKLPEGRGEERLSVVLLTTEVLTVTRSRVDSDEEEEAVATGDEGDEREDAMDIDGLTQASQRGSRRRK